MVLIITSIVAVFFLFEGGFKLTNHVVALLLPWVLILFFSAFEISYLHKSVEVYTYLVVFLFLISYYAGFKFCSIFYRERKRYYVVYQGVKSKVFNSIFFVYVLLTALNVILAGYIPLLRLIYTGDSGYLDFGIPGLYGFYNAFSNAVGLLGFYLFLTTKKYKFLCVTFIVLFVFVLFVTRQNVISLLVEMFVVYSFVKRETGYLKLAIYLFVVLVLFDIIGNARTADIHDVAEVKDEYRWLPTIVVWVYSYFYINFVNLNNLINFTAAPYFDGSSFSGLVPNVIKGFFGVDFEHEYFLEKINFNISSALNSMYSDHGVLQVVLFAFVFSFVSTVYLKKTRRSRQSFIHVTTYSVLFFCAAFSFFTNFWFFLPVIFQVPVLYLFDSVLFYKKKVQC